MLGIGEQNYVFQISSYKNTEKSRGLSEKSPYHTMNIKATSLQHALEEVSYFNFIYDAADGRMCETDPANIITANARNIFGLPTDTPFSLSITKFQGQNIVMYTNPEESHELWVQLLSKCNN